MAAANLAYQQSAAGANGDGAVGDAQANDDYVDAVYGDGGEYDTWHDTVSGAEAACKLAQSTASETLYKNLSAHDAGRVALIGREGQAQCANAYLLAV